MNTEQWERNILIIKNPSQFFSNVQKEKERLVVDYILKRSLVSSTSYIVRILTEA
jgi:hypothetical protein